VNPDISFRMPFRLLRTIDQSVHLRQQARRHVELACQGKACRRPLRPQQQLLEFAPDALGGQIVEWNVPADCLGGLIRPEIEPRGKLQRPQHAQRIVRKGVRVDDAQDAPLEIVAPVEGVDVVAGQRIPHDGVDGKVTPPRGFRRGHCRIAGDREPLVPASGFRLAPWQRHIDVLDFVDRERLSDRFDAAKRFKQPAKLLFGDAEHLHVDLVGIATEQLVADEAADDERPPAVALDELCNGESLTRNGRSHCLPAYLPAHPPTCPPAYRPHMTV
jgi:hypothetical protein